MTEQQPLRQRRLSLCVGCGSHIQDQYILRVAPDLEWHASCLKCVECAQFLDENCTCFVRDGKTYCRRDYVRLFGAKCDKCGTGFSRSDFVMRAKSKIYHIECFRCTACQRQLVPGDEFALRDDGLYCKDDHQVSNNHATILNATGAALLTETKGENGANCAATLPFSKNNNNTSHNNNNNRLSLNHNVSSASLACTNETSGRHSRANSNDSHSDSSDTCITTTRKDAGERTRSGKDRGGVSGGGGGGSDGKPTRVRTVLNEKQLHTLRTCYAANPRPDALMKEQLVEMTGLSPRVIRVWFQNKRCKDKKKAILMKQIQQQEKDGRKLGFGSMQGIPLIASSPVRHESPLGLNPVEVHAFAPPWKALAEFALHNDLERIDPSAPHFQQLINQMHGYDLHGPPDLSHHGGLAPMDMGHGHGAGPILSGPGGPHPLSHGPPSSLGPSVHHSLHDPSDAFVPFLDSDDSMQHEAGSP